MARSMRGTERELLERSGGSQKATFIEPSFPPHESCYSMYLPASHNMDMFSDNTQQNM